MTPHETEIAKCDIHFPFVLFPFPRNLPKQFCPILTNITIRKKPTSIQCRINNILAKTRHSIRKHDNSIVAQAQQTLFPFRLQTSHTYMYFKPYSLCWNTYFRSDEGVFNVLIWSVWLQVQRLLSFSTLLLWLEVKCVEVERLRVIHCHALCIFEAFFVRFCVTHWVACHF